jgi:hypothetical protein
MDEIRDPAELGPKLLAALNAADLQTIIECCQEDGTWRWVLDRPNVMLRRQ